MGGILTSLKIRNRHRDRYRSAQEREPTSTAWREIFQRSSSQRPRTAGESLSQDESSPVDANITAVPSYDKMCPYEDNFQIHVQLGRYEIWMINSPAPSEKTYFYCL